MSEAILALLLYAGIELVVTVSGGPLMPFLKACESCGCLRVVACRHETAACLVAASYYHDRGVPACVAVTSGPGAANAANGVLHAFREQAALILLSARPATYKVGRGAVQDLDGARFFAPFTKRSEQLLDPSQVHFLIPELLSAALSPSPGPVNLTVSSDQWEARCGGAL